MFFLPTAHRRIVSQLLYGWWVGCVGWGGAWGGGGVGGGGGVPYGTPYGDPRYHHHFGMVRRGYLSGTPSTNTLAAAGMGSGSYTVVYK